MKRTLKSIEPLSLAKIFGLGYAAMGLLFGLISGFVYNLIARWIGGIQVEVE